MTQNQHHNQAGMWKRVQQLHHVATSFRNRCNVGDQVNHASAAKIIKRKMRDIAVINAQQAKKKGALLLQSKERTSSNYIAR
jgi:hypothetical protein